MLNFEIKLKKPIEISVGENKKKVEKIEIRKPVSKYRFDYVDFYQELTRSLMSIKPSKEDSESAKRDEDKKKDKEFDQEIAIALGSMHMSKILIQKMFNFLEIGDKENPTCLIFGEKIQPLELDLLKDELDDIDVAAILGGIIISFLPLMQQNKN